MLSRLHQTMYIRIRKDIPILSEFIKKGQRIAIYFEQEYHEGINNFFYNHDFIYNSLDSKGIAFIYFPAFIEHLDEYVQYLFPDSKEFDAKSLSANEFYKVVAENIVKIPPTGRPMLLVTDFKKEAQYPPEMLGDDQEPFCCFDLEYVNDDQFHYDLGQYVNSLEEKRSTIRFHKSDDSLGACEEEAPYGYDADKASNDILFNEIAERVAKLTARGVNKALITQFLFLKEPLPSKLLITDDFRLLLPDYGNREIKMPKLSKALYFLYLRHKEGLLFKELRDHKDELYDLYRTVSPREDMDAMEQSVEGLVDSTKNNINVNCSRIKNAFVSEIDDSLARRYYIVGRAGEAKRIALDRSLVEDQSGMIM